MPLLSISKNQQAGNRFFKGLIIGIGIEFLVCVGAVAVAALIFFALGW